MARGKGTGTAVLVTPPNITDSNDGVDFVDSVKCETIRLEERLFGARDQVEEMSDKELQERPICLVPDKSGDAPGGFDVCREYGYKYEYTQDYPGEDGENESQLLVDETAHGKSHPLHQTTAVVSKTKECIPYIHLLGKTFHPVHDFHDRKAYERSLFWFTYRCDFPQIMPYGIDTDAGWGCMVRSAQMLLGHTLRIHFKSRQWKPNTNVDQARRDDFVKKLLTWFADFPSKNESVYSLHNFVAAGYAKYETIPGEWWGPGTACYVIRDLVELHQQSQPNLFRVHVSAEGTVYRNSVHDLMTKESKKRAEKRQMEKGASLPSPLHPLDPSASTTEAIRPENLEWDTSLLLLVPLRLGLDKFNESYVDGVARSFWLPQSVGVLGGRPRGARWFYGAYADGSKVLGLDPHTVQAAPKRNCLNNVQLSNTYMESVHTTYPEVYQLNRMDPSLAVGFYCRDKKDFLALETSLKELKKDPHSPDLFTFADNAPNYLSNAMNDMMLGDDNFDEDDADNIADDSDEDYVLL